MCERIDTIYTPRVEVIRIPIGFTPFEFKPVSRTALKLQEDRIYAISVSRLITRKDHATLLQAFQQAGIEQLELLLVGEGPQEKPLKALSRDLGIDTKVHFLRSLSDEAKYQYLNCADIFALASLHEGFGIVYQEAMSCGLPIVTTNVGGQTDFLKEGHNALLCPPQNPETLARSIQTLCSNEQLRKTLGQNNREAIKTHSIEKVARQYLEHFNRVTEKGR